MTIPPYASGSTANPSVTPTTGSQFPSAPVGNDVATREAAHISRAQAQSPVQVDNDSPPVTVQEAWDSFNTMSSAQRKEIQQQMFDGGLLTKQSDVSGNVNPTSLAKWKDVVEESATSGSSIQAHLDIAGSSQVYRQIGTDLQKQATSLQTAISAPKSLDIPLTNDAVLRAYAEAAFTQALGHSPSEEQLGTFVQTFHDQEVSSGKTQLSEPRQYDQEQLGRTQGELDQLKSLGPNGLDAFVQSYKAVMSGANPTGTVEAPTISPGESALGTQPNPVAPLVAHHGGDFAMLPQTWVTAAKAANVDTKRYPTPMSAPAAIQSAVFSHYADGLFQHLGNWADVAVVAAGGKPGQTEASFGSKVASEVNDQLKTFTGQVNAPGPDNIVASASADTSGQAAKQAADQAAKESDPTGYYAHQVSLYEGLLDRIAGGGGGLPQQDISSSTVSGPVAPIAAPTPAVTQVAA